MWKAGILDFNQTLILKKQLPKQAIIKKRNYL